MRLAKILRLLVVGLTGLLVTAGVAFAHTTPMLHQAPGRAGSQPAVKSAATAGAAKSKEKTATEAAKKKAVTAAKKKALAAAKKKKAVAAAKKKKAVAAAKKKKALAAAKKKKAADAAKKKTGQTAKPTGSPTKPGNPAATGTGIPQGTATPTTITAPTPITGTATTPPPTSTGVTAPAPTTATGTTSNGTTTNGTTTTQGPANTSTEPPPPFTVSEYHPPTTPTPHARVLTDISGLITQDLADFETNTAAGRSFSNGVWTNPGPSCWNCYDSAATASAVLYRQGGATNTSQIDVAVQTFNTAIATQQQTNGSFAGSSAANGPITTEFFLVELGTTYLELQDKLDTATKARWSTAIQRAADYLITSGQTTWYANGNIQLRLAEDMWLAWKITGQDRFDTAYEAEWTFAMAPPQARWPGYGLQVTKAATQGDGSDGSAYLAENGPRSATPGFDPEYTMTQLDTATSMWVLSRDPRYLNLMNLLLNQLQPRVDSQWTLDATGGTRYSITLPFYDVSPEVLVNDGDRPDLTQGASVQLWRLEVEFTNTSLFNNPNYYKGLSGWASMVLLDAQWPQGIPTPTPPASSTSTGATG